MNRIMSHRNKTSSDGSSNDLIIINDTDSENEMNERVSKRRRVSILETENLELRKENFEWKERCAKYNLEFQQMVLESDSQQRSFENFTDESTALKTQNLTLKNEKNLSNMQKKKTLRECEFKTQEIRKQKRKLKHELNIARKSNQTELEKLKADSLKSNSLLSAEQNKVIKLRATKQKLENDLEQKDKEKSELQHQVQHLNQVIAQMNPSNLIQNQQLKQELETSQAQVSLLKEENVKLRQNVQKLDEENDKLAVRVNSLNSNSTLAREVDRLREELKITRRQLSETRDDNQRLTENLQFANDANRSLRAELLNLKNDQSSKIKELKNEISDSNTEIASLSSQLKEAEQKTALLTMEIDRFGKEKKENEAKIQLLNQQLNDQIIQFEKQCVNAKAVNDEWSISYEYLEKEFELKSREWESSSNSFKNSIEDMKLQIAETFSTFDPLFAENDRLNIRIADLRSTLNEERTLSKVKSKDCDKLEREISGVLNEKKELYLLYEKAMNELKMRQEQVKQLEEKHDKLKGHVKNFEKTHNRIVKYGQFVDEKRKEDQKTTQELKTTLNKCNEEMTRFQSECHKKLADKDGIIATKDSEIRRLKHSLNNARELLKSAVQELTSSN